MSNSDSFGSFYVSDIGGYVSIDAINASNEREMEEESLSQQFNELGQLEFLTGVTVNGNELRSSGVTIDDWKWEIARAEKRLNHLPSQAVETVLLGDLIAIGKTYALGRYARKERISREAGKAAALPYGIQALLHKFFLSAGLRPDAETKKQFVEIFRALAKRSDITAYEKTGFIQKKIHDMAQNAWGSLGAMELNRSETREMLSLTRLHFLILEPKHKGFSELMKSDDLYQDWSDEVSDLEYRLMPGRKFIPHWTRQHILPLRHYYPIEIRAALKRGVEHARTGNGLISHLVAVNEIALANCSLPTIKIAARDGNIRPLLGKNKRRAGILGFSM